MKLSEKNKDFFQNVYDVVRLIPKGRITSYGAIARYLGSAKSARMVGWAMNASHNSHPQVPAHRVVNSAGLLTGKHHFGNPFMMQSLLENEGIMTDGDRISDFKKLFWDPVVELKLLPHNPLIPKIPVQTMGTVK